MVKLRLLGLGLPTGRPAVPVLLDCQSLRLRLEGVMRGAQYLRARGGLLTWLARSRSGVARLTVAPHTRAGAAAATSSLPASSCLPVLCVCCWMHEYPHGDAPSLLVGRLLDQCRRDTQRYCHQELLSTLGYTL